VAADARNVDPAAPQQRRAVLTLSVHCTYGCTLSRPPPVLLAGQPLTPTGMPCHLLSRSGQIPAAQFTNRR
jgi:hypothetical protein